MPGSPVSVDEGASRPSAPTSNATTRIAPGANAYKAWPLRDTARSVTPVPMPVTPAAASASARLPSRPTWYWLIELLPALPVYANLPLGVTATQQAAVCNVGTEALTSIAFAGCCSANTYEEVVLAS